MEWKKSDIINICKIVAFGIVLYWILNNLTIFGNIFGALCSILSPFIIGAGIAFVVNIPMSILEKKVFTTKKKDKKKDEKNKVSKIKRLICILISILAIIMIIIGVLVLVIPELGSVINEMITYISELVTEIIDLANQVMTDYPEIKINVETLQTSLESAESQIVQWLANIGTNIITSSFGMVSTFVKTIAKMVVAIIFSIYILIDKEKICFQAKRIVYAFLNEKQANKVCELAALSERAFYNFITGQFTECIILGTLCGVGMAILRIPYSVTVGVLVAVTAFIPIVGAFIGGIIGVILLLPISTTKAVIFLIFFILLQQTENNLIYPRVVGSSVGVPGILVLVAITLGGALGGAVGMIVSLPITSVLYTLIREATDRRLKEKKEFKEMKEIKETKN